MISPEELKFAQKYPFSSTARRIVKENSFSLENIPDSVRNQAGWMVFLSAQGKPLEQKIVLFDADSFLAEIQAFPVAKILLSLMKRPELHYKFASMMGKRAFASLEREKKKSEALFSLAEELEIKYSLSERRDSLVSIPLIDFLKADFSEPFMKLCNQKLEKGKVFLNQNGFARFLAAFVQKKVFESLPVPIEDAPKQLKQFALELSSKISARQFREFDFSLSKNIAPEAFPDCIAALYNDLLAGKNIAHLARFDLAVFLAGIGMPKEQIINAFRKAPNFSEKTTRYHIENILKKKYKPASCAKMRDHGINCANCGFKHPLQYYRAELRHSLAKAGEQPFSEKKPGEKKPFGQKPGEKESFGQKPGEKGHFGQKPGEKTLRETEKEVAAK